MDSQGIKPGNEARVRWYRGEGEATDTVLVYLHGFTASPGEAGALPEQMADALAANLYVHRWPGHGVPAPDAMRGLTSRMLFDSALDAVSHASRLGRSVVLVGTSLGASLALWLAATQPAEVVAVAAWSPGIRAAQPELLEEVCALQGAFVDTTPTSAAVEAYWSQAVHPDGYRALRDVFQAFADDPPWTRVTCPVFLGYFRASSGEEDQTASVPAMLEMFAALGTVSAQKEAMPFAAGAHGIGSPYKSPLAEDVAQATVDFLLRVKGESGRDVPSP